MVGEESTRKKNKTKRRSHRKMGESTHWYQQSFLDLFPVWLPESSGIYLLKLDSRAAYLRLFLSIL